MEAKGEVPRADLSVEVVDNEYSIGDVSRETPPPPPPPKEARSCPRKQDAVLNEDPCAAVNTGSPSELLRHPNYGIAVPVAMRESDQSVAGRKENKRLLRDFGGNESKEQERQFYFDLGRSMMLDSFE